MLSQYEVDSGRNRPKSIPNPPNRRFVMVGLRLTSPGHGCVPFRMRIATLLGQRWRARDCRPFSAPPCPSAWPAPQPSTRCTQSWPKFSGMGGHVRCATCRDVLHPLILAARTCRASFKPLATVSRNPPSTAIVYASIHFLLASKKYMIKKRK